MKYQAGNRLANWALAPVSVFTLSLIMFLSAGCSSAQIPEPSDLDVSDDAMIVGDSGEDGGGLDTGGGGDGDGEVGGEDDGSVDGGHIPGEDGGGQCHDSLLTPCDGTCVDLTTDPLNCGSCGNDCGAGMGCSDSQCGELCLFGFVNCDGTCVNIQTDGNNCGACGTVCGTEDFCQAGHCVLRCNLGMSPCGDSCVNLSTDVQNCGQCFLQCSAGQMCAGGECSLICYGEGRTVCDGACVDLNSDRQNCGSCGTQCGEGYVCLAGECAANCPTGWIFCDGVCRNGANDRYNCGDCGNVCGQGRVCYGGECVIACPDGQIDCNGECADLNINPFHCGGCDQACQGGMVCLSGECVQDCGSGLTKCGGGCVDLLINRNNCGQCGRMCDGVEICSGGDCQVACPPGFTVCGDSCEDLAVDSLNCGQCGLQCVGSEVCTDGVCFSAVAGVQLSPDELELALGERAALTVRFTPVDVTERGVMWESSDPGVASVDEDGVVTGAGEGSAVVTATTTDGGFSDQVAVQVRIPVTGLTLSEDYLSMRPGESAVLEALVEPVDATLQGVVWSSDTQSVATVDQAGRVTAVAEGEAVIAAVSQNGGYRAECTVAVTSVPVTGITLSDESLELGLHGQVQLVATVSPANASNKSVIWFSDNANIASVSGSGLVTGNSGGSTHINAVSQDGGFQARCSINVKVPVTGIVLTPVTLRIDKGTTSDLEVAVVPEQASDKRITWSSSNQAVATVGVDDGVVTGVGAGSAIITASTVDGGFQATCEVTVWSPVTRLTISPALVSIPVGGYADLQVEIEPADASNPALNFLSTNKSVATVTSAGRVSGISPGVASVIAMSLDTFKTATATIVVLVPVASVSLNKSALSLVENETHKLIASVLPENAEDKQVVWESTNGAVATVDQDGNVRGVSTGTATVRVTTVDGGFQASCTVTVIGGSGSQLDPFTASSLPGSCALYRQMHSGLHNGHYVINPKSGVNLIVYCDMISDGVGYTFYKVNHETNAYAVDAEAYCNNLGMRLFIPRTRNHLISAYMIATNGTIGPDSNANYLYIMGIYPQWNGATCRSTPLMSSNPNCNWRAGDGGPFWVTDRSDISEPNGDNNITSSMYYTFQPSGEINGYNDINAPGYGSTRFICDTGDNY